MHVCVDNKRALHRVNVKTHVLLCVLVARFVHLCFGLVFVSFANSQNWSEIANMSLLAKNCQLLLSCKYYRNCLTFIIYHLPLLGQSVVISQLRGRKFWRTMPHLSRMLFEWWDCIWQCLIIIFLKISNYRLKKSVNWFLSCPYHRGMALSLVNHPEIGPISAGLNL